jgi:hypothetical protein
MLRKRDGYALKIGLSNRPLRADLLITGLAMIGLDGVFILAQPLG